MTQPSSDKDRDEARHQVEAESMRSHFASLSREALEECAVRLYQQGIRLRQELDDKEGVIR